MESPEIKSKRIFLTGGTGFFGKSLLEYIKNLDKNTSQRGELCVLSRTPDKFCNDNPELTNIPGLSFIKGDVRDFEFPAGKFGYVIHAATEADSKLIAEKPTEMYSVIVDGTRRVLEMCEKKQVSRVLYVSSGAVYGAQPPDLPNISEDYPCAPADAYEKGKFDAEKLCLASTTPAVVARCFAFVGPYLPLDKHFAVGNFINNILNNEDINIKGDGTPYRSYMYASDLAEWLWTLLLKGKTNEVYNVGSDKAISIAELAKVIRQYSSTGNTRINIAQKAIDGILPSRYVPCIDKAKNELNLKCKVSLTEGIEKTINSNSTTYKNNEK